MAGQDEAAVLKLSGDPEADLDTLRRLGTPYPDLVIQRFQRNREEIVVAYLTSITDRTMIHERILVPLLDPDASAADTSPPIRLTGTRTDEWRRLTDAWAKGWLVVLRGGDTFATLYDVKKYPSRQPHEPSAETVIKGNHTGFVESFQDNLAMIRSFLNDGRLVCRTFTIGTRSRTSCGLLYLQDVANEEWVDEMTRRIQAIDADAVLNIGILEEWVEDTSFSIFPQFLTTERPDVTVSHLLHGRVAVLLDNSSGAIAGPASFLSYFQSLDDHIQRWPVASFIRLLRMVGFLVAVFLPSVYIAALTYNYEIIPIDLLMSIGRSREKVPLPPIIEALIMEIVLEMLREAGLRLPSKVGQTVGIVGGIIIGQAAVQAGVVSNMMVIVVSFTAVASFIQPQQDMAAAIRLLRFPFMLAAYMLGAVGIVCGMMIMAAHILSLQSLRSVFGAPFAPLHMSEWRDGWIRLPRWALRKRPMSLLPKDNIRQRPPGRFDADKRESER